MLPAAAAVPKSDKLQSLITHVYALLHTLHCRGPVRLHWGKAGWPDAGCWRGDEHYGLNWCHFG